MTEENIKISEIISVGEFAEKLGVPAATVVAELMKNGVMATINENIDFETAAIIAEYLGKKVEKDEKKLTDKATCQQPVKSDDKDLIERPPVVAVLGHVDHGKTYLLDTIRKSNVIDTEAGGITQHISSYQIERKGKKITFVDTPGHSAFEEMRERGAQITDIALVLIAADDGIKAQTLEAINHVKKAHTSLIVVITKLDKPDADKDRVLQQMAEINLIPEEWGGHTLTIGVSAKSNQGLDELLDLILLLAELKKLRANPKIPASGVVVESKIEAGKGAVAKVIVQNGTLRIGDCLQIGKTYGKVRALEDYKNKRVKEISPGTPAKISGIKEVAQTGEFFTVFADDRDAKDACENYLKSCAVRSFAEVKKINADDITQSMRQEKVKELKLVVKADVKGSLDAICQALDKIKTPEASVKIVNCGVGEVNESDVMMAETAGKLIVAFNAPTTSQISQVAKNAHVQISNYRIIYELIDDIKGIVESLLPPKQIEIIIGRLEVLKVFSSQKKMIVAGGKVTEGKIEKNLKAKVIRNGEEVGQAKITSVKRGKDEVSFCQIGSECGLGLEGVSDIQEKDQIVSFVIEEQAQKLNL